MKILVLWRVKDDADPEKISELLLDEERFAWRMYREDQLREHYASAMPVPAISILEMDSVEAARAALQELPINKAGFLEPEYYPLGPFENWEVLFREEERIARTAE